MKNFTVGVILIAVLAAVLYFTPRTTKAPSTNVEDDQSQAAVTDFKSCEAAGFPVEESYPAICQTPDGKMFSETVTSDVIVIKPQIAEIVTSPMDIKARVRGSWFFEANLPIELQDEKGKVIAQQGFMTTDNWMTSDYIDVVTTLSFKAPSTDYGKLVFKKDNPSGDPSKDQSFEVPVRFK